MSQHYLFVNEPLNYAYDALEPYIDTKTMEVHHGQGQKRYVDNLNAILASYPKMQSLTLEQLVVNVVFFPPEVQVPILNNAGGVYNHQFYFAGMSPTGAREPVGVLAQYIDRIFGNFDRFREAFFNEAMAVFGSGYAWLIIDRMGMLRIVSTPNQSLPPPQSFYPILNMDVWEHAYFLKHYGNRAAYIRDWFQVVDWEWANQNFMKGLNGDFFYGIGTSEVLQEYL